MIINIIVYLLIIRFIEYGTNRTESRQIVDNVYHMSNNGVDEGKCTDIRPCQTAKFVYRCHQCYYYNYYCHYLSYHTIPNLPLLPHLSYVLQLPGRSKTLHLFSDINIFVNLDRLSSSTGGLRYLNVIGLSPGARVHLYNAGAPLVNVSQIHMRNVTTTPTSIASAWHA